MAIQVKKNKDIYPIDYKSVSNFDEFIKMTNSFLEEYCKIGHRVSPNKKRYYRLLQNKIDQVVSPNNKKSSHAIAIEVRNIFIEIQLLTKPRGFFGAQSYLHALTVVGIAAFDTLCVSKIEHVDKVSADLEKQIYCTTKAQAQVLELTQQIEELSLKLKESQTQEFSQESVNTSIPAVVQPNAINAEHNDKVIKLEQEIAVLRAKLTVTETDVFEKQLLINQIETKKQDLSLNLFKSEESIKSLRNEIVKLEEQVKSLNEKCEANIDKIAKLKSAKDSLKFQLGRSRAQSSENLKLQETAPISNAENDYDELKNHNKLLASENSALKQEITESKSLVDKLKAQLDYYIKKYGPGPFRKFTLFNTKQESSIVLTGNSQDMIGHRRFKSETQSTNPANTIDTPKLN